MVVNFWATWCTPCRSSNRSSFDSRMTTGTRALSAAVPWIGMLIAIRSPAPRRAALRGRELGDPALPAEQRRDVALLCAVLLDVPSCNS